MSSFEIGGTFVGTSSPAELERQLYRLFCFQNLEPTSGFEPLTRCLQIRGDLRSCADFVCHGFATSPLNTVYSTGLATEYTRRKNVLMELDCDQTVDLFSSLRKPVSWEVSSRMELEQRKRWCCILPAQGQRRSQTSPDPRG